MNEFERSKQPNLILLCLGAFGLLMVMALFDQKQKIEKYEVLKKQEDSLKADILAEEKKVKEIEKTETEINLYSRELGQNLLVLPNDLDAENLMTIIRNASDTLKVPPFTLKPKIVETGETKTIEFPIDFEVTYEQLGQFLSALYASPRLIELQSAVIEAPGAKVQKKTNRNDTEKENSEEPLNVKLVLRAYGSAQDLSKYVPQKRVPPRTFPYPVWQIGKTRNPFENILKKND